MNSIVRIATVSNEIFAGNPQKSAEHMANIISTIADKEPDVILFPKGSLIGTSMGDMLKNRSMPSLIEDSIAFLLESTKQLDSYVIVSGVLYKNYKPADVCYILYKGEVLAILDHFDEGFSLYVDDVRVMVYPDGVSSLVLNSKKIADSGCGILLVPDAVPAKAMSLSADIGAVAMVSRATATAIAVANGGIGDVSYPEIRKGYTAIYEVGEQLGFQASLYEECVEICDIDGDIIDACKAELSLPHSECNQFFAKTSNPKKSLLRTISTTPYLPTPPLRRHYLHDLFNLQVSSLAKRIKNIGVNRLVIGVSGGLDSTLALLVCASACDELSIGRNSITAVTMQGLGTSDKTYSNATKLMQALKCTIRDIPIKSAALSHLLDIGHDQQTADVTYENAQARERTQVLLDLANMEGGIVIGTGDLSELALGFCTFGGDALSNFNVNSCLNKTTIREMVSYLASGRFNDVRKTLIDILETPISPELLPLENGEIEQKTEEILGEYELHDFFLHYFVKYNFAPQKILGYALSAFCEKYEESYIKDKLRIFLKRFVTSQFKRSCTVDSADITEVNLNGFTMPSDISNIELLSKQI